MLHRTVLSILSVLLIVSSQSSEASSPLNTPVTCQQEADCLANLGRQATRKDGALLLRLEDGRSKVFQNNELACQEHDADNCLMHQLRAYLPNQNVYVVEATTYEDGGAYVISAKTGSLMMLSTSPEFSPSGRWLVSVDSDEMNDRPYDIVIWPADPNSLKPELRYSQSATGPYEAWEFLGWDGDDRIRLKVSVNTGNSVMRDMETSAIYTKQGWKLNWPLPGTK